MLGRAAESSGRTAKPNDVIFNTGLSQWQARRTQLCDYTEVAPQLSTPRVAVCIAPCFSAFYDAIRRYLTLSLADAREKMKIAGGRSRQKGGVDPAAAKIRDRASKTIGDLAHEYLTKHAKVRKSSWAADERQLSKDVLPPGVTCP